MVLYKYFAELIFVVQGFLTYSANSILCPPPYFTQNYMCKMQRGEAYYRASTIYA